MYFVLYYYTIKVISEVVQSINLVSVQVITIGNLMGPMAFPANGSGYLGY